MTQPSVQELFAQAVQQHQAGRFDEADAVCRQVLGVQPNHAGALHLRGVLAFQAQQLDAAVDFIQRAVTSDPFQPIYHNNLGRVLAARGEWKQAIEAFRSALSIKPDFIEACKFLGDALEQIGELDQAADTYRRAYGIRPDLAALCNDLGVGHYNLGVSHETRGQPDRAMAAYREALTLNPALPEAHYNLGKLLQDADRTDEAIDSYQQALVFRPDYFEARSNMGTALAAAGRIDEAVIAAEQALMLRPTVGEVQFNLGAALMLKGDLVNGFRHFARWHRTIGIHPIHRGLSKPWWDGTDLAGRTILLYEDQGFGDIIQFIRYAAMLADRGGRVVLLCPAPLKRLMQTATGIHQVVTDGDPPAAYDVHCPLMSLPAMLSTTLETIPAPIPYLHADATLADHWKERLSTDNRHKIGLCWAGRSSHRNDRHRSIPPSLLAPLGDIQNASLYSLQKAAPTEASRSEVPLHLIDWTSELTDFAETAALISNLDLVISADTAVAHLAAAMGKPVWLLLPFAPDWRWMLHRTDSPWYPTMKLLRQEKADEWEPVIQRVEQMLRHLIKEA